MLLLNLTVDNFGVFRGTHSFELAPQSEDAHQLRHLTIFSGHNGSGKTTIFQAIMLALHGSLAFSDKLDLRQYHSFISNRMYYVPHEAKSNAGWSRSSVSISFQYVRSGQILNIQVERRWHRQGRGVQEALTVLQNGAAPDVDVADYQTWLNDLIPPGLGYFCFFDAEQLDALASPEQQNRILRENLERLLGIDLIQRLQNDMEQYALHQGSPVKIEHLYAKVLEYRSVVDELDGQLDQLRKESEEISTDLLNCEAALAQQERLLASEGGAYATRRPLLKNRLQTVQKDIETISSQLRELVTELLPFALTPELCVKLSKRLTQEIEIRRQQSANALWEEKMPDIEATLAGNEFWKELEISSNTRQILADRLLQTLRMTGTSGSLVKEPIIHHLAEPEHERLQQWITHVIQTIPEQVQDLGKRLRELRKEQRHVEIDLQRAPDDDVLAPIHAEISRLRETQFSKQRRQTALNEQIGSLQFQRNEKFRLLQHALEQYEKAHHVEKQAVLAQRTKLVLRTYKDILTRQRLQMLEEALQQSFNKICRKEYLLSGVRINPDNFSIQLEDGSGIILDLNNFSAGERQLYALALLWALRQVSARQLPLVVDTPLARLDEVHRWRFIHDYVPLVSDQVILFTTDAELDTNLLAEVKPYLARIYHLQHNSQLGETTVVSDNISLPHDRVSSALV